MMSTHHSSVDVEVVNSNSNGFLKNVDVEHLTYSEKDKAKLRDKGGNYFSFRTDYLFITSMEGAVVIQQLMNWGRYQLRINENFDGWFFYPSKLGTEQLNIDRRVQNRILKMLEDLQFIYTRNRGWPRKRQILINMSALDRSLEKAEKTSILLKRKNVSCTEKCTTEEIPDSCTQKRTYSCTEKCTTTNDTKRTTKRTMSSLNETTAGFSIISFDKDCSLRLHNLVSSKFPEMKSPDTEIKNWYRSFSVLRKKQSEKIIKEALDLYIEHAGEDYWPEIYAANSFRQKFKKLQAAIKRFKKKQGISSVEEESTTIRQKDGTFKTTIKSNGDYQV